MPGAIDEKQAKLINDVFEKINPDLESLINSTRTSKIRKDSLKDHDYLGMIYMGFSKYFDILSNNLSNIESTLEKDGKHSVLEEVRDMFTNEAMKKYIGYDFENHIVYDYTKLETINLEKIARTINNITSEHIINLKISSFVDGMTKLFNHTYIKNRLIEMIPKNEKIGVAMIDLDFFKAVNDIYGHQIGDKILKEVSNLMKETIGSDGIVARYGGEEFFVVLPGKDKETTYNLIESLRQNIEKYDFNIKGKIDFDGVYERLNKLRKSKDSDKQRELNTIQEWFGLDLGVIDSLYKQENFDALGEYLIGKLKLTFSTGVAEYSKDLEQARDKPTTPREKAYSLIGMADKAVYRAKEHRNTTVTL